MHQWIYGGNDVWSRITPPSHSSCVIHICQCASKLANLPLGAVEMIAAGARCPDGAAVGFPKLSSSDATNEADEL